MNERIFELSERVLAENYAIPDYSMKLYTEKFAELIIKEMCGMMEQTEDDCYHCFEPSERPTEYIEWLRYWQERFTKHFGVEK
jgi:hypothetical protein